jgi:hypothetical protein
MVWSDTLSHEETRVEVTNRITTPAFAMGRVVTTLA